MLPLCGGSGGGGGWLLRLAALRVYMLFLISNYEGQLESVKELQYFFP